ncbi:MAG: glycosyltransferase family 4 protein [Candidatus Binatia bacterium]
MEPSVHQLVPNLAFGDAISQQAMTLRGLLRGLGRRSEIYAENVDVRLRGEARPYRRFREEQGDDCHVVFHFSLGSAVTDFYRLLPNPRTLVYHNITPPEFFRGVNEQVARLCALGREELVSLRSTCRIALADSEFNRRELEALGFERTEVLPIVLDPERYEQRSVRRLERAYRDGHVNFLHVGRLVPNKRIEDVLKTFWFYRRKINADSRLFLVGIDTDMEIYSFALRSLVEELGLPGVVFAGRVTERALVTYYRLAHVYLCMSEHEGFCAPLVEAMHFGVPVIAYAAGAVPDTLGGAGALVFEKRFAELAELASLVCEGAGLREAMVSAGRARASDFVPEAVLPNVRRLLEAVWA